MTAEKRIAAPRAKVADLEAIVVELGRVGAMLENELDHLRLIREWM